MEKIILTIITPVYNSRNFIEKCIQNVIDQKCVYIEHLIIDALSDDGTKEIIEEYASKYDHIRFISERDNGQSDAMNKGIQMAQGNIISFLNADDGYYPYTLNRIVSIFEKNYNLSFIAGNCKLFDDQGNLIYFNRPQRLRSYHLFSNLLPFPINPAAYFYKKHIHDEIGFYDENDHYTMDYDFLLRCSRKINMIYFNEEWGYAIYHEGSKTQQKIIENLMASKKNETYWRNYNLLPRSVKIKSKLYRLYKRLTNV
jgi:glycosyltransferase involved in cell wall biosynthesis